MQHNNPEVVRIGAMNARITSVSEGRIDYIDEGEQERWIDLAQCARNWLTSAAPDGAAAAWNSRCVGARDTSASPPFVEFNNERQTRFEFEANDEDPIYVLLLGPLGKAGWHTFDQS